MNGIWHWPTYLRADGNRVSHFDTLDVLRKYFLPVDLAWKSCCLSAVLGLSMLLMKQTGSRIGRRMIVENRNWIKLRPKRRRRRTAIGWKGLWNCSLGVTQCRQNGCPSCPGLGMYRSGCCCITPAHYRQRWLSFWGSLIESASSRILMTVGILLEGMAVQWAHVRFSACIWLEKLSTKLRLGILWWWWSWILIGVASRPVPPKATKRMNSVLCKVFDER